MITYILLILMGVLVVFMMQKNRLKIAHLLKNGARAEGTVIDHAAVSGNANNSVYPVIRFMTGNNQSVTVTSKEGFLPGRARKGKKLIVFYNPSDPQNDFTIQLPKEKIMYITVFCFGILIILTGVVLLLNQLDIIHILKK